MELMGQFADNKEMNGLYIFQSAVAPNGLTTMLDGSHEGKKYDNSMIADSNLLAKLNSHFYTPHGKPLCIYEDPAYLLGVDLQGPFRNNAAGLTLNQEAYDKAKSQVRTLTELVFGDIVKIFYF